MSNRSSSSNPPRKFSEKMAIIKKNEAAINANFDQVMRGIGDLNENLPHNAQHEQILNQPDFDVDLDNLVNNEIPYRKEYFTANDKNSKTNKQTVNNDLSKFHPNLSSALLSDNSQRLVANTSHSSQISHHDTVHSEFGQSIPNSGQYYPPVQTISAYNRPILSGPQQAAVMNQNFVHQTMLRHSMEQPSNHMVEPQFLSGGENSFQPAGQQKPPPFFQSIPSDKAASLFGLDYGHKTSSLPNVFDPGVTAHRASTTSTHLKEVNRSNVDLQSALHVLERIKNPNQRTGRDRLANHIRNRQTRKSLSPHPYNQTTSLVQEAASSPAPFVVSSSVVPPVEQCSPGSSHESYSPHQSPRHRPYSYRRNRSPYANPYLSPPGHNIGSSHNICQDDLADNWRRTASDSAIHQSLQDSSNNLNLAISQAPTINNNSITTNYNVTTVNNNISNLAHQNSTNVSQQQFMMNNNAVPNSVTATIHNSNQMFSCPTSPLSSVQQQFEAIRMVDSPFGQNSSNSQSIINSANYSPDNFSMNFLEPEVNNRQSAPPGMMTAAAPLPDIILTEPEIGRRDSYTIANEILSSLGTVDPSVANQEGGPLLDDLTDADFQILTDPSFANYVTDDYTEEQLLHDN